MDLKKVWRSRKQIWEGILNTLIHNPKIEKIASKRLAICQSNKCGYYDHEGKLPIVYVKGKPACGVCGCNAKWLTHSLSSNCSLKLQEKDPLWIAEMTDKEEEEFRNKTGLKNESE